MSNKSEQNWDDLCALTEHALTSHKVPGVSVGILHQGKMFSAGFGVTNVNHPMSVTDETLFQIGSITKTYTGTAIMRLVETGEIDLDTSVQTYVPDFHVADDDVSAQVTIRHLLTHVSGWVGDFFADTGAGDDAVAKYVADMADLEQLAPLGSVWSYNNSGFCLAGYIIEMVTGQSYQTALKELLLEPLKLNHSFFDPGDVMTHRFAVGHSVGDEGAQVAEPWPLPRAAYSAGGITCDVKDLLQYGRFHLGDGTNQEGTRLLTEKSLHDMQTPQVTVWEKETWGLTWAIDDSYATRFISHGGGTTGQISGFTLVPEHDFAIAILTNADRGGLVVKDVTRHALKLYCGVEIEDPTPIETPAEKLKPYIGLYQRPFMDIELGLLGGRLVAQMTFKKGFPAQDSPPPPQPPPVSLTLCGKDCLLAMNGPSKGAKLHIIRKDDGSIGWLRSGRIHIRQD